MVVKKPKNSGSKPKDTVKGSASDSQFQSLIETAIDIVAVLNEDGTIRYLSPSVQRITGYSPEELIGQSAFVHMHEEDVDEQLEVFKATVSNPDQATQGLPHSFRFKHKDGHWVVLESVSNKLPSGLEAPGIVVNARDVTERTQALESMRETAESERRLSEEHEIIAEIGRIISSDLNLKDVFELFAAEVSRLITFDMIAASVVDNLNQTTTINYCSGPEEYIEDFQATVPLSGSFTGQVVSSGKPVIIQGSAAHEHGLEGIIHPVGTDHHGKVLSRLGLPMTNRGEVIGALIFFSSQPEAFSELDVAMAERVCYQIAGAINNATLFDDLKITEAELASTAEERGKVASQNEVIAEIGRIVSSTLNIDEVYEPFADQVHKLIDYDVFGIAVVDMEKEQFRVAHRVGDNLLGKTIGSQLPFEGTIIGEVVRSGKAKIVQGVSKGYLQENYPVIVSTYESGVRSWLCVPLINRGTFVGTVLVHSRQENAFKDSDIELVERVCNQIAGAIASAGLFDDLKTTETQLAGSVAERTKVATQNEVIAEIGRIISSTLDIDEIYEPFAEQVRKLIDYDVLAVGVVHEVGRTIRLAHRFGDNLLGKTVGEIIPFKGTLTGEVEKTKQPIIFQGTPRAKLHERFPEAIPTFESGVRSWLCIPLVNRTEFVGTLLVLSKSENAFDEHDVELAQRVGNQIAGAIDSVRLFAGIKAVEADLAISVEERTEAATQNEVIAEIGRIIGSALNIEEVYEPFTIQVRKLIHYDILGIGVFEPDGKSSRIAHRVGDDLIGKQIGEAIPFEGSVSGGAAKVKHAIIVQGISREDLLKNYPISIPTYDNGVRSWLCVPLINRGELLGTLQVLSRREDAYGELDINLAQRVGDQIAGAISGAETYSNLKLAEAELAGSVAERIESANQNETIAEIGRIIGTTIEIGDVYQPFADQVGKLIDFDVLAICIADLDGKSARIAHRAGDLRVGKEAGSVFAIEGSMTGEVRRLQRSVIVQDTSMNDLQERFPFTVAGYQADIRSWLCAPMINGGNFVGSLLVLAKKEHAFSDKDSRLAERIGDQIAGAIDHVRLFGGLKVAETALAESVRVQTEAAYQNEIIAEIGRITSSTLNIEEVYESFANQVGKLIDSDVLAIGFLDELSVAGRIAHWSGKQVDAVTKGTPVPFEGSLTGEVSKTWETFAVQGVSEQYLKERLPNLLRGYHGGLRSWICSPLINRGDFVGSLVLISKKENAFTSRDLELAQRVAHQISGAIDSGRLISDLEKTQADLANSNNRNQMILDTAHDAYIGTDDAGQVTAWNTQAEETFGWSTEDAVQHTLIDLIFPTRFAEEHLSGIKRFLTSGDRSLMNQQLELVASHRDGHEFPVEMTISPLQLEDRHIFNYFIRDITERQAAEQALKRSEEQFRAVYNNAANGMGTRHFDGTIKDVNPAFLEMVGYTADELRELNPGMLYDTKYYEFERSQFEKLLQGEEVQPYEKVYIRKDGIEILTEIRIGLERDAEENAIGVVAVVTDITERQRLEEERARTNETLVKANQELQELDRLKDEFISTVSHELRTPLTSIKGSAEILLAYDDEDRDTQVEFLRIINKECDRLTRLVTDVLDLSRMESRQMKWMWEELDLAEVVSAAVDSAQSLLIKKDLFVKVDLDSDLPLLWNDRDRLAQVVTNLLSNSIKFTPTRGKISINAKRVPANDLDGLGEKLEISITDTGIGIHFAEYESIFQKFRQGVETLSDKPTGTGLGLAICKEIVEYIGGNMWVDSTPGKGSTFYFTIPVHPEEPPEGQMEEPGQELGYTVSN